MNQTQCLLTAARDYIAEKPEHWQQGDWGYDPFDYLTKEAVLAYDGACCAYGAIILAGDLAGHASATAGHFFRMVVQNEIAQWNDAPGRTREEVIAAFDRAIEAAA